MKVRAVMITALLILGGSVGIAYGVSRTVGHKAQPVEVVPVSSVNSSGFYSNSSPISGVIVSRDTQSVELDSEHDLKAVYVKMGERVKKGDKLLEYDMESDELKAEMEDLTRQGMELHVDQLKKDLASLKAGKVPAQSEEDALDSTSQDGSDEDTDSSDSEGDSSDSADEGYADLTQSADTLVEDDTSASSEASSAADTAGSDPAANEPDGALDGSSTSSADNTGVINTTSDNENLIDDEQVAPVSDDTLKMINSFLNAVNAITSSANGGWDNLLDPTVAASITEQMGVFRNNLSESTTSQITDLFHETRVVTAYTVSSDVRAQTGDATAAVLQQAYDRLTAYQFIYIMKSMNPNGTSSASWDSTYAKSNESLIRTMADAFYDLTPSVYTVGPDGSTWSFTSEYQSLGDAVFEGEAMVPFLQNVIANLQSDVILDRNQDVESTEGLSIDSYKPSSGDDSGGDGETVTAEELKSMIEDTEQNIKEYELQIRESKLEQKEYDRTLAQKIQYAAMDGIVKSAGTVDEEPADGPFILITGKAGLYVKGALSEMSLDTLKIGDTITGTSYDTGSSFLAEITEISPYPSDGNTDMYYGTDNGNTNSSQYPFYAYIEQAEGLTVDSSVDLTLNSSGTGTGGLSLEGYFVRSDRTGRSYCFVRGKDNKLEKRYVQIGGNNYGAIVIQSGLRADDLIAFPYGEDVFEGAQTKKVETLSAVNGDSY